MSEYVVDVDSVLAARVGSTGDFTRPGNPSNYTTVAATPDGSLQVVDLIRTLGLQGLVFGINYGQGTTFVSAKTSLTATEPDMVLDVPNGTTIIPLQINLSFATMAGTANHFFVQIGHGTVGSGTSTVATAGPTAFGSGFQSKCVGFQAYSGAGTAPATPIEIFSLDDPTAATGSVPLSFQWTPPSFLPLVGPATIAGYGASTTSAITFKAQIIWAELPSAYVA